MAPPNQSAPSVLIIGQAGDFNLEGFVSNSFRELGWNVQRFNVYQHITDSSRLNNSLRFLAARSNEVHKLVDRLWSIQDKIISAVKKSRPDLLFVFKGELFPPKVAETIRRDFGARVALWFPDDPRYLHSLLIQIAPSFDHVVVSSRSTVPILERKGIRSVIYSPFACDPSIHKSLEQRKTYPVSFVGTYYPDRARLLSKLIRYNIRIWGPYWRSPWVPKNLRRHVVSSDSYGMNLVNILNRSKITINVHHKSDLQALGKLNMRIFEATGSGSFLITDAPSGLEDFYAPGREIACYSTPDDLVELVDRYLHDDTGRKDIAAAGQERAHRDHTYTKRLQFLLNSTGLRSASM